MWVKYYLFRPHSISTLSQTMACFLLPRHDWLSLQEGGTYFVLSKLGVEADLCRRCMVMGGWDMVLFFTGLVSSSQTLVLLLAMQSVLSSPKF